MRDVRGVDTKQTTPNTDRSNNNRTTTANLTHLPSKGVDRDGVVLFKVRTRERLLGRRIAAGHVELGDVPKDLLPSILGAPFEQGRLLHQPLHRLEVCRRRHDDGGWEQNKGGEDGTSRSCARFLRDRNRRSSVEISVGCVSRQRGVSDAWMPSINTRKSIGTLTFR